MCRYRMVRCIVASLVVSTACGTKVFAQYFYILPNTAEITEKKIVATYSQDINISDSISYSAKVKFTSFFGFDAMGSMSAKVDMKYKYYDYNNTQVGANYYENPVTGTVSTMGYGELALNMSDQSYNGANASFLYSAKPSEFKTVVRYYTLTVTGSTTGSVIEGKSQTTNSGSYQLPF